MSTFAKSKVALGFVYAHHHHHHQQHTSSCNDSKHGSRRSRNENPLGRNVPSATLTALLSSVTFPNSLELPSACRWKYTLESFTAYSLRLAVGSESNPHRPSPKLVLCGMMSRFAD